jgi:octaprenyl-diphosphate synthase
LAVVVDFNGSRRENAIPALDRMSALVAEDLVKVNQVIVDKMDSPVPLIPQLAGHIIASGGKRLRPMLTLAAAKLCGYQGDRQVSLAACVEFIHTATLLHDDVVDASDLRRGADSANAVWGNQASVLVGDFLFSRAFQLMVQDGSLNVLRILSKASATIAEGEVMQLLTANDTETQEAAYFAVIRAKTAKLFAAAAEIGAVVAERPESEQEALESYGMNFGIAFQIVDDVLDYSAEQAKLGKTIGDDFREGKITLPVILSWLRGDETERTFWRRTLADLEQEDGDLEHAIVLMNSHDALSDSIERARHYGATAKDALGLFSDHPVKQSMTGLVDFCIDRAY